MVLIHKLSGAQLQITGARKRMGILHITIRSDLLDSFPLAGSETLYRMDTVFCVFEDIAVYTGKPYGLSLCQ